MKKFGFSLIELLITLALIAILSSISYPLYSEHLTKVRRTYAITVLEDLAGRMEEYYLLKNSYDGATLENLGINNSSCKNYYDIKIIAKDDTYVLQATPREKQANTDILCGSLTLDQSGNKNISGTGLVGECW